MTGGHSMAYADALALATANAHKATLLGGDPETLNHPGRWLTENLRR